MSVPPVPPFLTCFPVFHAQQSHLFLPPGPESLAPWLSLFGPTLRHRVCYPMPPLNQHNYTNIPAHMLAPLLFTLPLTACTAPANSRVCSRCFTTSVGTRVTLAAAPAATPASTGPQNDSSSPVRRYTCERHRVVVGGQGQSRTCGGGAGIYHRQTNHHHEQQQHGCHHQYHHRDYYLP